MCIRDRGWGSYVGVVRGVINSLDAAELRGSNYRGKIWTGGTSLSTSTKDVQDLQRLYTGLQVCMSGSVSLNHCGHPVTNTNYTFSVPSPLGTFVGGGNGFTFDQGGTVTATGWRPGGFGQPGDSGGPVYTQDGTAHIAGIHSARIWNNRGCGCWTMIGVKMLPILAAKGADLVHGYDN